MLAGYLIGQLPAGFLSDKIGGDRVLLTGLLLASASLMATGQTASHTAAAGMVALAATRVAFGLFSATAMPAVSALAAKMVPAGSRSSATAMIYALFNLGA